MGLFGQCCGVCLHQVDDWTTGRQAAAPALTGLSWKSIAVLVPGLLEHGIHAIHTINPRYLPTVGKLLFYQNRSDSDSDCGGSDRNRWCTVCMCIYIYLRYTYVCAQFHVVK